METPQHSRPTSRDRGVSDSFTLRPRYGAERDPACNGPSPRGTDENRSPATLPRVFEGMLKTTTETGDIGMFSIKPSRVPQSLSTPRRTGGGYNGNGLQKSRQTFQSFGVPNVDDRRRLPSYARDATSEVISMYESASEKSAIREFDDPDYRSYSMTQTSYSAYTLSNHRSYASLRSQQDSNGLLQRPRSPFAYPARLKRPGFRPSSPALTDGGLVDYSRRAEIDRTPYGDSHGTSSPSSLYAQKRKLPLSLRQETNRSTPSLLSQPSPPRRSLSPALQQSSGNLPNDWAHRNGSASGNTSPARSTFSLASTVNLYATVSGTSNSTTPGKLVPSSPLYYDYTEDFEGDGYPQQGGGLGSLPQFSIEKTIPEERPMSTERPPSTESRMHLSNNGLRLSSSSTPTSLKPSDVARSRRTGLPGERESRGIQPSLDGATSGDFSSAAQVENAMDKKVIRLSSLGSGAQQLSTHVEEFFGLLPTKSFEISVPRIESETNSRTTNGRGDMVQGNESREAQFISSPMRVDAHPPRSSSLPLVKNESKTDAITNIEGSRSVIDRSSQVQTSQNSVHLPQTPTFPADLHKSAEGRLGKASASTVPASSSQSRNRSNSGLRPIETGFTELADLMKMLEDSNRAVHPEAESPALKSPEKNPLSPNIPDKSMLQNTNTNYGLITPVSSFYRPSAKDSHVSTQVRLSKRTQLYSEGRKIEASTLGSYEGPTVPNFSHQMEVRAIPRSGSPMLAPKPISPARQLKLKNSVPQLMKALPPLPPEMLVRAISPSNRFKPPQNELPCRFSPFLPECATPVQEPCYRPGEVMLPPGPPSPVKVDVSKILVELGPASTEATSTIQPAAQNPPAIPQPPPRLKLKMRNSATLQPMSSSGPRPCSTEESYPWSTLVPNACQYPTEQAAKSATSKLPKFRLKVTRATGSTFSTVRVNRESRESKAAPGFHLRNHKDLFSSGVGIDDIFRQVSRHLHSRKASTTSNTESEFHSASTSMLSPNLYLKPMNTSSTTDLKLSRPQSTKPLPSTEARSVFSDDSSRVQGQNSVRGRLSNLRARIAVPYANRTGSQSYDDLTWRDRNRTGAAEPMTKRSVSNLHASRKSTEGRPLRRFAKRLQHHRLKEKVHGWLKEARFAIASCMKSRSTTVTGWAEVRE